MHQYACRTVNPVRSMQWVHQQATVCTVRVPCYAHMNARYTMLSILTDGCSIRICKSSKICACVPSVIVYRVRSCVCRVSTLCGVRKISQYMQRLHGRCSILETVVVVVAAVVIVEYTACMHLFSKPACL